ncbi:MAG: carbohydrate kinase family protein, partial [Eubacteriales bacterium]|nr:carbohydrate kinase family protein [Eubacteriales bacterium]
VETTVKIERFPLEYCPIDYNFFGINSYPAGVGLNLSLAFSTLSDEVKLLSMVGSDPAGVVVRNTLNAHNVSTDYLFDTVSTAQSVVLYDDTGNRRIFCDLKDFQDKSYDEDVFIKAASDCDTLCLCNINFSRNLLKVAKRLNKNIACDVHTLSDIYDDYNRDYMQNADILFLSNENIKDREEEFLRELKDTYPCKVIVVGMGKKGSLMYVRSDNKFFYCDIVKTREVVNTVGAGDSLFSSFVHFYTKGVDPYTSLKYATVFASYKIGESGAAKGFLTENELLDLANKLDI